MIEDLWVNGPTGEFCSLLANASDCVVSRLRLDGLAALCAVEGEEVVAARYLVPGEFAQWQGFRLPKRRLEWLGGRIAAKDAAMRWQGLVAADCDWQQWQLAVLPSGRPEFAAGVTPLPEMSISHSDGQAVAVAMGNRCGIDIQYHRDAVVRVISRFAQPGEVDLLAANFGELPEVARLTMLWSVKEAIRKAVQVEPLPAFEEMELAAVRGASTGVMIFECCFRRPSEDLRVEVGVILDGDFAVALAAIPTGSQFGDK